VLLVVLLVELLRWLLIKLLRPVLPAHYQGTQQPTQECEGWCLALKEMDSMLQVLQDLSTDSMAYRQYSLQEPPHQEIRQQLGRLSASTIRSTVQCVVCCKCWVTASNSPSQPAAYLGRTTDAFDRCVCRVWLECMDPYPASMS
jgi:hypothetical protein